MAYLFWTALVFIFLSTVFYFTRSIWTPYAPAIPYLTAPGPIPERLYDTVQGISSAISRRFDRTRYVRLSNTFQDDVDAGLSSAAFDLAGNVEGGDARAGLDDASKAEVQRIMKAHKVGFDEARRIHVENRFGKENIGRDGRPRDPKAVMFDRV